jgi:hypothetical protein
MGYSWRKKARRKVYVVGIDEKSSNPLCRCNICGFAMH